MFGKFFKFIFGAVGFLLLLAAFSVAGVLVTLYVFNRMVERDEVVAPNVINLPSDRAVDLLVKMGLNPRIEDVYDPAWESGRIVSQRPLPGARVKRGRTIELSKSAGNPEVVAPRVVGRVPRDADVALVEQELAGGRVVWTHDPDYPQGQVFAQRPRAGSTVLKGQPVDMLVSLGPVPVRYRMPRFEGLPEREARRRIVEAGLNLNAIELTNVPGATPDHVLDQSPMPGEPVEKRTPVILRVAAAVDSDPGAAYQWLQFELPPSVGSGEVVVLVIDSLGERVHTRTPRPEDGKLEVVVSPLGDAEVMVYQDGVLVAQEFLSAPD